MKKFFMIICCFFSISYTAQSQVAHDYIWLFGDRPNEPQNMHGGSKIDFHSFPPNISYFEIPLDFEEIAMISDSSGQLLFYTNGCAIANKEHKIMVNGDSLNPGKWYNSRCHYLGYPTNQAEIILPMPGNPSLYYLFHLKINDFGALNEFLLYTVIDMEKNGGLGEVIKKNQLLYTSLHFGEQITAVRHGNGRDWWIVLPHSIHGAFGSNKYYKFLFDSVGISATEAPAWGW